MSRTTREQPQNPPTREPVRTPWPWVGLAVIILVGIPWYLPAGTIGPIVLGLPLWTLVAVASSVGVAAYLSWMVGRFWNLVEDQEEAVGRAIGPDAPSGELDGRGW